MNKKRMPMTIIMTPLRNQDGFALITSMIILIILTLLGIFATNTTVVELNIAGNEKVAMQTFFQADGGTQAGSELIEQNVSCPNGFTSPFPIVRIAGVDVYEKDFARNTSMTQVNGASANVQLSDIPSDTIRSVRISSDPANRSDTIPHTNLAVWGVTKLMVGSALQMVAGYEGKGKGAAGGGSYIEYTLLSQHEGVRNSEARISSLWRHIVGQEGTCHY